MKICRFDEDRVGIVEDQTVIDVTPQVPSHAEAFPALWLARSGSEVIGRMMAQGRRLPLEGVLLKSPIAKPCKVVAAPVNYKAHVQEMLANGQAHGHLLTDIRQAGLFLKATSSVVGPSEGIAQRFPERRTDYEVELCVVIGQPASRIAPAQALSHVAGYCMGLDITVRGPEDRSFRKSVDSYCVLGPWLTTVKEVGSPDQINIELTQNGVQRQYASTADMVMSVSELIAYASEFYTLQAGDVIMTGTPQGVGPIQPGDLLVASGTNLGSMTTRVRAVD